jgi:hypothetical protein
MIIFLFVAAFFVFSYHFLRNGIPWKDYGTTVARLIWAASFALGYTLMAVPHNYITVGMAGIVFMITAFLAMLVPHAFCQNMGTWPTPQKQWPAFFMPTLTAAEWTAMTPFARTRYDFFSMMGVGAIRAVIVYGITTIVLLAFGKATIWAVPAGVVTALSQPVGYLIGKYVPFSMWSTPAKSASWGEVMVAIGWAVSLAVYCAFSAVI